MMALFLLCLGSYLTGGIPTAFLAGRVLRGIDIRQHGSGNVGATNAVRVLGRNIGYPVFFIDFLKGYGPVYIASFFVPESEWGMIAVGVASILGHVFTPYLAFKGGKGVATGAGVLCALYPGVFATAAAVWLLVFAISRIVSISSMAASACLPIASIFLRQSPVATFAMGLLFLFTLWSHRGNIRRLLARQGV